MNDRSHGASDELRLLTPDEAAGALGISEYAVRAEHARGVLPGRRVGRRLRFTKADLEVYVERIADDLGRVGSGQTAASRRHSERQRGR